MLDNLLTTWRSHLRLHYIIILNGYYKSLFTGKIIFDFEGINALELPLNLIPRILSARIKDFIFSVLHSKDICDADVEH